MLIIIIFINIRKSSFIEKRNYLFSYCNAAFDHTSQVLVMPFFLSILRWKIFLC